jgi:hypothetical protein
MMQPFDIAVNRILIFLLNVINPTDIPHIKIMRANVGPQQLSTSKSNTQLIQYTPVHPRRQGLPS